MKMYIYIIGVFLGSLLGRLNYDFMDWRGWAIAAVSGLVAFMPSYISEGGANGEG